jgi:hypothetical protein
MRRNPGTVGLVLRRAVYMLLLVMLAGAIVAWMVYAFVADLDSSLISYPGVGLLIVLGCLYALVTAPLRRDDKRPEDAAPAPVEPPV